MFSPRNFFAPLFLVFAFFSGCLSPEDIYNKYSPAVVLIKNSYIFEYSAGNYFEGYISQCNPETGAIGAITFDREDSSFSAMLQQAQKSFGTGFFIDREGRIMTNRHVVFDAGKELVPVLKGNLSAVMSSMEEELQHDLQNLWQYRSDLLNQEFTDTATIATLNLLIESVQAKLQGVAYIKSDLDRSEMTIRHKLISIEVLMKEQKADQIDDNFDTDYIAANVIKVCNDPEVDLAVIQLKERNTPAFVKEIFDLAKTKKQYERIRGLKTPKLRDNLFMIGYNMGKALTDSKNGAKPQFTSGEVLQERDDRRILYSINALSGSSGSPVLDGRGNLVAVNYAKVINSQNFNFGIPTKEVLKFYFEE